MEQTADQNKEQKIVILEEQLRKAYNPVKPAPEFIDTLQQRLIMPPRVILDYRKKGIVFIVMTLGLVFGTIVFILIRAIYRLLYRERD